MESIVEKNLEISTNVEIIVCVLEMCNFQSSQIENLKPKEIERGQFLFTLKVVKIQFVFSTTFEKMKVIKVAQKPPGP